jgi:predicted alpha/beta hydrolase
MKLLSDANILYHWVSRNAAHRRFELVEKIKISSAGRSTEIRHFPVEGAPTWLMVPALGVEARYYDRLGAAMAALGVGFAAVDVPGHGAHNLRAKRGVDYGYNEIVEDVRAAAIALRQHADGELILGGHSLGGQAALIAANEAPVDRVCVVACCIPWIENWDGSVRRQTALASYAFPLLSKAFGYYPGHLVKFAGREGRQLMTEWAKVVKTGAYPGELQNELLELEKPVTAVDVVGDMWAPARAVDQLKDVVPSASLTRKTIEDGPWKPGIEAHFKWATKTDYSAGFLAEFLVPGNVMFRAG